jgi:low temperature requirement protein LtrA
MSAKGKKRATRRQVSVRIAIVFIAGVVGSGLVSRLIPQVEWVALLPAALATGIIIPDVITLMRRDS